MIDTPKVSVIVPVYKVEPYLRQCVESLLVQTLSEIQIILVDDGSPDHCPEICNEYARKDPRIQVLHQENQGLLRARISGMRLARADYVGFVDSDDFAAPTLFETLYQAAVQEEADMVCSSFWLYYNENQMQEYQWSFPAGAFSGRRLEEEFYPQWFEERKTGKIGLVKAVWCKLFRRTLLQSVYDRLPGQVTIGEDLITTYGVAAQARRMVVLPEVRLYYYRQSDTSMMGAYWRNFFANELAVLQAMRETPCLEAAKPWLEDGLKRYQAYMLYDILYNECNPQRNSTPGQRRSIARIFCYDQEWRQAAALDVLPQCDQTSRLLRRLLLARKPRLLVDVLWLATLKNRMIRVIQNGR